MKKIVLIIEPMFGASVEASIPFLKSICPAIASVMENRSNINFIILFYQVKSCCQIFSYFCLRALFISRLDSCSFMIARLSPFLIPRPMPIKTLALFFLK